MKRIQTILSIIILILLNFHIFNFMPLGGEKNFIFQYNYYWYIIMSLLIMFNTEFSNVFHFKEKQFKTNDKLILFMQTILCIQLGLLFFFENTIALTISFIITIIIAVINMFNISKKENNIPYLNFKAINMFLIIYNLPCLVSIIQIVSKGGEILNSLQQFLYSGGFLIVQLFFHLQFFRICHKLSYINI